MKEFCHPVRGSTNRDRAAHKRLRMVLAQLDEVELVSESPLMSPSGEVSPAKEARTKEVCTGPAAIWKIWRTD